MSGQLKHTMYVTLAKEAKNATKELRLISIGHCGGGFPSKYFRTMMTTAIVSLTDSMRREITNRVHNKC
jgi:hypothetical protein